MSSHERAVHRFEREPRQPSKTQLEMVMFLKPPLDSVPSLMRPCADAAFGHLRDLLEGAVEDRAEFVDAGDVAVGDGEVFGGAGVAEGEVNSWGRWHRPRAS